MRRLLFILLLSGLASGCATTSEVGPPSQGEAELKNFMDGLRSGSEASRQTTFTDKIETQRQRQREEQLNQARQSPAPSQPVVTPNTDRLSLDASKVKCTDLGFKPGTEAHGKCVLQLSK